MADEISIVVRADDQFSGVLGNFGNIITGIKSAIDLAGDAFRTFAGFAMEGLDAIASYERMGASLQSLVASQLLMNDAAKDMASAMDVAGIKAESLLGWIQELAIKSPFTAEGVAQAFRLAMAYGFTAEEAQRLTQAMIDFSAGTGATEYNMQLIARALGQISTAGKLTGQDMLQLTSAGLPVAQILADAFGVTTEKIIEMRSDGLLPAKEVIEALTVYLETNFKGAAEAQSLTWAGLMGTFADLKAMGLREFFGGLFDVIQPLAVEFSTWLQGEGMDKLREWGEILGAFTQNIVDKIPDAIAKLEELTRTFNAGGLTGVLQAILGNVNFDPQAIVDWLDNFDIALAGVINSYPWRSSGTEFGKALLGIADSGLESQESSAASAIATGLQRWFIAAFNVLEIEGTDAMRDFWDNLEISITDGLRNALNGVELGITNWVRDKIIDPIKEALGIASPSSVFADIGRDIVMGLIVGFGSAIGTFINIISGIVETILALFAPVLDIFGIDIGTSTGGASGTSDLGSNTSGAGGLLTGEVINNYYGPVYFMGAGEPGSYYDCPSPNPLMESGSGGLVTTGFSGGT